MNPWILWAVASLGSFGLLEGYALLSKKIPTLSASVRILRDNYPFTPWVMAIGAAILLGHFYFQADK